MINAYAERRAAILRQFVIRPDDNRVARLQLPRRTYRDPGEQRLAGSACGGARGLSRRSRGGSSPDKRLVVEDRYDDVRGQEQD